MTLRRVPLVLAAAGALLLAGCTSDDPDAPSGGATPPADGFPVTVGELTLDSPPTAIVSLSPTATEMLFAIGAGDEVVAVDDQSTYPADAPITDLSGFTPNVEAIATYDPDLVVISYDPGDLVTQLGSLDIPVHLVPDNPRDLTDVYAQIADLGTLTGHPDEAADLVEQMSTEIDQIVAGVPERESPLRYYFEIEDTLFTYTSESIVGSLLEMVGGENIAVADDPSQSTMQLSPEFVVSADPEIIFLANAQYGETVESVSAREGWSDITAVRTGRIVELSPDIAARWGPRVPDLMREIADAVSEVP